MIRVALLSGHLLSMRELSLYFRITRETLNRWHRDKYLPKPDEFSSPQYKQWMWRIGEVNKWLKEECMIAVYREIELEKGPVIESLINIPVAMRRYDLSDSFFYKWIYKGELPYLKVGFGVRFEAKSLEKFIKERMTDKRFQVRVRRIREKRIEEGKRIGPRTWKGDIEERAPY